MCFIQSLITLINLYLSGAGSVHTANGIMLQDFEEVDSPSNACEKLPDIPSSGAPATDEIEDDVLCAEKAGEDAKELFITERLAKKHDFFELSTRMNLKTFVHQNKTAKILTSKNKLIEYKQQGNIAFKLLVQSQCLEEKTRMKELMTYPLTPIPYSIGTADGMLLKTETPKGLYFFTKDVEQESRTPDPSTLIVNDGKATLYCLKDIPTSLKQISLKLFKMTSKGSDVVFSTDSHQPNSIKSMERARRGSSPKLIIKGENTRRPLDWKMFLKNDENKQQLTEVILKVWSSDLVAATLLNPKDCDDLQ